MIFVAARRCPARWTEPLFLPTGAVRNEVRPIRRTYRKSTKCRSESAFRVTRAKKLDFFTPSTDVASIWIASVRFPALLDGLFSVPGRLWALSGHPWGALGTLPGAPGRPRSSLEAPRAPRGSPGASLIVLASILGASKTPWERFGVDFDTDLGA